MKEVTLILIFCINIIIISPLNNYASIGLFDENSPDWVGTEAIRNGDYEKAHFEILNDSTISDSAFRLFKLGCVHQGLENWSKALFYFRMNIMESEKYAPFAYERIGDIEFNQGRYESSLKAYRAAVDNTTLQPYKYILYKKMHSIAVEHADTLGTISWLEDIVGKETSLFKTGMKDIFYMLMTTGGSKELDSALQNYMDPSLFNNDQCSICSLFAADSLIDSLLSTKTLYLLSKTAFNCKMYKQSSGWLHKSLDRENFSEVIPRQQYIYYRAVLNYRMKNYRNVIKWINEYNKSYNSDPSLIYMIARAYRYLGNGTKAVYWYDKHIELFPQNKKTYDIIWYRAWQKEDLNQFAMARRFYRKIFETYKNRSKADDAYFRYALTYCKEKNFKSALEAFTSFLRKYPSSRIITDVHYWRAKCFFSVQKYRKAKRECRTVLERYPTNYYAFRARELLVLMGDSCATIQVDTTSTLEETIIWLDSIAKYDSMQFTETDSTIFYIGSNLASVGMIYHAELFMEKFEILYIKNLLLQHELARLYKICNDPTRSFRIAKRLSWRIPASARSCMPVQIYSLLYPNSFSEYIISSAKTYDIEPEIISSIIRQESIFDPKIESPVGAIGLMQIMPYTGESIAKDLNEQFVLDSLYSPLTNIRYGTYYIKSLLDQFKGNLVLALAGYNGGPHNAKRWWAQNSDDGFDMFVEDIGFTETRGYVKKVLGNYWTYTQLKKFPAYLKH